VDTFCCEDCTCTALLFDHNLTTIFSLRGCLFKSGFILEGKAPPMPTPNRCDKQSPFYAQHSTETALSLLLFLCFQVTTCSWWRSMSSATHSASNTPTTPRPSWLLSTSTWTPTTSNCPWTTCWASRRFMVRPPEIHGDAPLHFQCVFGQHGIPFISLAQI